jgi:hypothetical protein
MVIRPRVGMMIPAMLLIVVVLPAPFDQAEHLARPDPEREAADGGEVAVQLLQALDLDHRPPPIRDCRKEGRR